MGYGTDFGAPGATASGGARSGPGLLTKKLESGGGSSNPSGPSTSTEMGEVSEKKYDPNKHKKSKTCHKKHAHSKSCGGKK